MISNWWNGIVCENNTVQINVHLSVKCIKKACMGCCRILMNSIAAVQECDATKA